MSHIFAAKHECIGWSGGWREKKGKNVKISFYVNATTSGTRKASKQKLLLSPNMYNMSKQVSI